MASHAKQHEAIDYESLWQDQLSETAWGTLALFVGIVIGYVTTIFFTVNGHMNYGLASIICAVLSFASFTVMHDAGHGSIFKMSARLKPIETALGWISSFVLLLIPYRLFQRIHDRHHAFTNEPERDPDHFSFGDKWYQILANTYWIPFQYYLMSVTSLKHQKMFTDTYPSTAAYLVIVYGTIIGLISQGYLLEVMTLMVIPTAIALFFLVMFFDYVPHYPHKSLARLKNTRIFPSKLLNILLLGQNYHLIHHMYPRLPWYKYQAVYQAILPYLDAQGAPIEDVNALLGGPRTKARPSLLRSRNAIMLGKDGESLNMRLAVSGITYLSHDAVAVSFELPSNQRLSFSAGQYLTVSKWLAGEQRTRCYSICSAPNSSKLVIGVRRTKNGLMSNYLNQQLSIGEELIVKGPFGEFIYPPAHGKNINQLVLVAGGSGITPILSILKQHLLSRSDSEVHLFYASRSANSIMFHLEIEALAQQYRDRLSIVYAVPETIDQSSKRVERFDYNTLSHCFDAFDDKRQDNISNRQQDSVAVKGLSETEFYVCGPAGLKKTVMALLESRCIDPARIHVEAFKPALVKPVGTQFPVEIKYQSGGFASISVAANQTVLEVAHNANVSLPHACGVGTCGTCKVKLTSGDVHRIPNAIPGITQDEQDAGYTLACQCRPKSAVTLSIS